MSLLAKIRRAKPEKKRVVIHAGGYKTGTTYFQELIYKNRDTLLRKGIVYPELGLGLNTNHNRYSHRLLGINLAKGNKQQFPEIISGLRQDPALKQALISYEGFSQPHTIKMLAKMRDQFDDIDLHAVLVFRPHIDFLISLYRELCQHVGIHASIQGLLEPVYPKPLYWNKILFYQNTIDQWLELTEQKNIHVLSYRKIRKDLPRNILKATGMPSELPIQDQPRRNSTISAPMAAVMRRINRLEVEVAQRHELANEVAKLDAQLPALQDYCELSYEEALKIEEKFKMDRMFLKGFGLKPKKDLMIGADWSWGLTAQSKPVVDDAHEALIAHLKDSEFDSLRKMVEKAALT